MHACMVHVRDTVLSLLLRDERWFAVVVVGGFCGGVASRRCGLPVTRPLGRCLLGLRSGVCWQVRGLLIISIVLVIAVAISLWRFGAKLGPCWSSGAKLRLQLYLIEGVERFVVWGIRLGSQLRGRWCCGEAVAGYAEVVVRRLALCLCL